MLINLDKFLVEELNNRGFTCDYKSMVEIYRASRSYLLVKGVSSKRQEKKN